MASEQRFLGELLVRRGIVAADKLESLWAVQRERGTDLLDLVVNTSVAEEMALARALADEAQLPLVERIDVGQIPTLLATRVPIAFAKSHRLLVVHEDEAAVHVICGDPFDTQALDDLRVIFGKSIEASVSGRDRIEDAINRVYERQAGEEQLESDGSSADEEAASDILDSDDDAPVIRWVNSLFLQAMQERASDIHIETEEKEVIVRYRIARELDRVH